MAAPRGTRPPAAGKGRPKGAQNKATKEVRAAFQLLLENNLEQMQRWLDRLARKSPGKALDVMVNLAEYVTPKLLRTEHRLPSAGATTERVITDATQAAAIYAQVMSGEIDASAVRFEQRALAAPTKAAVPSIVDAVVLPATEVKAAPAPSQEAE